MCRMGIPDYLVTMRTPGDQLDRVTHTREDYPVDRWQKVASPVWTDINPSDTLQYQSAREHDDERHICPLQLEVIRRGVELWTNPGDVVLSPLRESAARDSSACRWAGSSSVSSLKDSYFRQARQNLVAAMRTTNDLFRVCSMQIARPKGPFILYIALPHPLPETFQNELRERAQRVQDAGEDKEKRNRAEEILFDYEDTLRTMIGIKVSRREFLPVSR